MENQNTLNISLLSLSPDRKELLLQITPVQEEVTVDSLSQLVNQSEYANLKIIPKGIKEAVTRINRLASEKADKIDIDPVAIAERTHARFTITIDPSKMSAKAILTNAYGGLPITLDGLKNELDELEITHGIINKNLLLLVKTSKNAKPGSLHQVIVAEGTPAIHGIDAKLEFLVETPKERQLKPKLREDGTVDMRDLGQLVTVKPETPLVRKIPVVEGFDGLNIIAETIPHNPGKDLEIEVGENTQICEQDENLLIATVAGIPKLLDNGMKVDDVLVIKNVDVGFGHVEYEGDIIIKGNVCSGMKVKANGDVHVAGYVESAYIKCSGNLTVEKGIIGHKFEENANHYSCNIITGGSIIANFSQYCKLLAGTNIHIKTQLLHCDAACQEDIIVLDATGMKGAILGGSLETGAGIYTASIGAISGTKTDINLNGDYLLLKDKKLQTQYEIEVAEEKLHSVAEAQQKINLMPDSEKKQTLEIRLAITQEEVEKLIAQLNEQLDDDIRTIETYIENVKVVAQKELFNNVNIHFGEEHFCSDTIYGPSKVSLVEDHLTIQPYVKQN